MVHSRPLIGLVLESQLTDWLAHVPKEVIAKNFHMSQAAFDHIPGQELYIFPGRASSK